MQGSLKTKCTILALRFAEMAKFKFAFFFVGSSPPRMSNYGAARAASKKRKLAQALSAPAPALPSASVLPIAAPAKKTRIEKASNLNWSSIVLPSEFGFDEAGGLLELDEVSGVEVIYGDGLVTFRVKDEEDEVMEVAPAVVKEQGPKMTKRERRAAVLAAVSTPTTESVFADEDLSVYEAQGIDEDQDASAKVLKKKAVSREMEKSAFEDEDELEEITPIVVTKKQKKPKAKKAKEVVGKVEEAVPAPVVAAPTAPTHPFDRNSFLSFERTMLTTLLCSRYRYAQLDSSPSSPSSLPRPLRAQVRQTDSDSRTSPQRRNWCSPVYGAGRGGGGRMGRNSDRC